MKKTKKFNFIFVLLVLIFILGIMASVVIAFRPNDKDTSNSSVDFTQLSYVALGDSITYGASSLHPEQYENGGYPQCVKNELGLRYAINYGDNGRPMLRFPSVVSTMAKADIVSVMGGVNDWGISNPIGNINDYNVSTFYGALNMLCGNLTSKYENSFIFFMTPYKTKTCTTPNELGFVLLDYVNAIKQVCEKWNIPVLDLYNYGNIEIIFNDNNFDGVHPTEQFFEDYTAPQIAQFIKDNYKK